MRHSYARVAGDTGRRNAALAPKKLYVLDLHSETGPTPSSRVIQTTLARKLLFQRRENALNDGGIHGMRESAIFGQGSKGESTATQGTVAGHSEQGSMARFNRSGLKVQAESHRVLLSHPAEEAVPGDLLKRRHGDELEDTCLGYRLAA